MSEKVTIYSIAQELGVSPSMVSRAFSKNGRVDPEKRELILKTAEKYNFSPNKFASRLSMKSVKIGVLLNISFDYTAKAILKGFQEAYEELKDYKIEYEITEIYSSEKRPEDCEAELNRFQDYDGVIVLGFSSEKCQDMLEKFMTKNPNMVQLQSCNESLKCLFSSKHNEKTASEMAAEFLYHCRRFAEKKDILLFTGNQESALHKRAKESFLLACNTYGLHVLECVDMKDREDILKRVAPDVIEKYRGSLGGIYITSGASVPLCKYLSENKSDISLITFDTYPELDYYVEKGTIDATIYQNFKGQAKKAFTALAKYLITGDKPDNVIYTDVTLIMRSNMIQLPKEAL